MKFKFISLFIVLSIIFWTCHSPQPENPAAEGFDLANSDSSAIELADSIMKAMGGRQHWDETRFISWDFFNARSLVWDKKLGRVRIESLNDSIIYLVDLNTMTGKVKVKGQEIAPGDSLNNMLSKGKSIWINDSYWLIMPFKLKDTGLTLTSIGDDTLPSGKACNVLELRFNDVGDTPQNKYRIFVDKDDHLVKQWSYYKMATQDTATFTRPWDNYKKYGNILLSADRSDNGGPKNVKVNETLPEDVFTTF